MSDKHIGAYTYGNPSIIGRGSLHIGKFCSFAPNVTVVLWGHHSDWFSTYPFGNPETKECKGSPQHPIEGKITIGNDVWVGANATIVYGAKIGDGAVISAGSVVYGKVAPYTVVAGNPAQFVYTRFNKQVVQMLQAMKWWNWDYKTICKYADVLQSSNVDKLTALYEKMKGQ